MEQLIQTREFCKGVGRITRVGFRVFSLGGTDMHFHGLSLHGKDGQVLYKDDWCDLGNWKYQDIDEDESFVGVHGQIKGGKNIVRIGLVTIKNL